MIELSLHQPGRAQVADALASPTGLLVQVEETLAETPIGPAHPAASESPARLGSTRRRATRAR